MPVTRWVYTSHCLVIVCLILSLRCGFFFLTVSSRAPWNVNWTWNKVRMVPLAFTPLVDVSRKGNGSAKIVKRRKTELCDSASYDSSALIGGDVSAIWQHVDILIAIKPT